VQLAASDTAAAARRLAGGFARAEPQLAGPAGPRILAASVGPHAVFRVLVGGFATARAARAACTGLAARGWACFVRGP
jgi:hypothetical protein